jgi:hypothetical protein
MAKGDGSDSGEPLESNVDFAGLQARQQGASIEAQKGFPLPLLGFVASLNGQGGAQVLGGGGSGFSFTVSPGNITLVSPLATAEAILGGAFTLNAASGTYQDTGISVALPAAGRYLLFADVRSGFQGNAGTFWYVVGKLYNSTDAADVASSEFDLGVTLIPAVDFRSGGTLVKPVTVTAAKTIKLYAARFTDGSFTSSTIYSDANGRTRLSYLRIG